MGKLGIPVAVLFLAGLSACSVNVGGGTDRCAPPRGGSDPLSAHDDKPVPTQVETLTAADAVTFALEYSPVLAAARKKLHQAAARSAQAGLWPNPTLEFEADGIPRRRFGLNTSENSVTLEQEIPLGGRLSAQSAAAAKEWEIEALGADAVSAAVRAEVETLFYKVLASQERVRIAEETLAINRELLDAIKARVEAGGAMMTDEIKARVETGQTALALARAQAALRLARRGLNLSIGLPELEVGRYEGDPEDIGDGTVAPGSAREALVGNPELKAAEKEKELAVEQLAIAQAERIPDVAVRFGGGRAVELEETEDGTNHETDYFYTLGISVPVPLFNNNRGAVREAMAGIDRAAAELKVREARLTAELEAELASYDQTVSEVRTFRDSILPDARQALELVRSGYEAGKFSCLELLDAQRTLVQARQAYADLLEAVHVSRIALKRLRGAAVDTP
ncbi:MAG: TolC family protein [Planctomycetota bacterium]|nr:TolC family protein [Planctomycetota bacterium]